MMNGNEAKIKSFFVLMISSIAFLFVFGDTCLLGRSKYLFEEPKKTKKSKKIERRMGIGEILDARLQEVQKSNEAQMKNFGTFAAVLAEQEKINQDKFAELDRKISTTCVRVEKNMKQVFEKLVIDNAKKQKMYAERVRRDVHSKFENSILRTQKEILKNTEQKLAAIARQRRLESERNQKNQLNVLKNKLSEAENGMKKRLNEITLSQHKQHQKVTKKQAEGLSKNLALTLGGVERRIEKSLGRLAEKSKNEQIKYHRQIRNEQEKIIRQQLKTFNKHVGEIKKEFSPKNRARENKALIDQQSKLFKAELAKIQDRLLKHTKQALNDVSENHKKVKANESKLFEKKLKVIEDKMLSEVQKNILQKTEKRLAEMSAKSKLDLGRNQEKQLSLLKNSLNKAESSMKKRLGEVTLAQRKQQQEVTKNQAEQFSKKLEITLSGAKKQIEQLKYFNKQLVGIKKEFSPKNRAKENKKLIDSQTKLFKNELAKVQSQMLGQTKLALQDVSKEHQKNKINQAKLFEQKLKTIEGRMGVLLAKRLDGVIETQAKRKENEQKELANRYLKAFDVKLSNATGNMNKDIQKSLELLAKSEEQRGKKRHQKLEKNYLRLFDKKLAVTQKLLNTQVEGKLKEVTHAGKTQVSKEIDSLRNKYMKLFNERLILSKNNLEDITKKKLDALSVADAKRRKDELVKRESENKKIVEKRLAAVEFVMKNEAEKQLRKLAQHERVRQDKELKGLSQKLLKNFDKLLHDSKNEMAKYAQNQLKMVAKKEERELRKERGRLNAEYMKLFESKLTVKSGTIDSEVDKKLKQLVATNEQRRKETVVKQKKELEKLATQHFDMFNQKISLISKDILTNTDQKLQLFSKAIEKRSLDNERNARLSRAKNWDTFAKKQLGVLNAKLSRIDHKITKDTNKKLASLMSENRKLHRKESDELKKQHLAMVGKELGQIKSRVEQQSDALINENFRQVEKQMHGLFDKKFQTLVKSEQDRWVAANEKREKEFAVVTSHMLRIIEARLEENHKETDEKQKHELKMLFSKLKGMNRMNSTQVQDLEKHLKSIQRQKMARNKHRDAIAQKEIDDLVKREVNKQLSVMRSKKDPRISRLKKVVALEKMRRLLKGAMEREGEEDIDF
jgi:hypothetical protein